MLEAASDRRRRACCGRCARSSCRSSLPGIAATALICFIFSWNELLFARVLTGDGRADRPGVPHRLRHQPGAVPGQGLRGRRRGLAAGARSPGSPPRTSWSRASRWARSVTAVEPHSLTHGQRLACTPQHGCADTWTPASVAAGYDRGAVTAGHRALRGRRLPPRPPGDVPRPADERRQGAGLGDLRGRGAARRRQDARRHGRARTASTRWCVKHPDGTLEPRVIGSIVELPVRPRRPGGGDREDGRPGHPDRLADRSPRAATTSTRSPVSSTPTTPASRPTWCPAPCPARSFGLITEALARRRDRGRARRSPSCPATTSRATATSPDGCSPRSPGCGTPTLGDWVERRCGSPTPWSTGSPRSPPTTTARAGRAVRRRGRLAGGVRAVHPVGAGGQLRRRPAAVRGRRRAAGRRTSSRTS